MSKYPITTNGYDKLQDELRNLKVVERKNITAEIARAREFGDLSENAEYASARERQSFIEGRILHLEDMIARSEVIDISKMTGDVVRFGATVSMEDDDTGEESTYCIVSEYEADLKQKRISLTSPIAKALLGKKKGDSVEVRTPKGEKIYHIVDVKYL